MLINRYFNIKKLTRNKFNVLFHTPAISSVRCVEQSYVIEWDMPFFATGYEDGQNQNILVMEVTVEYSKLVIRFHDFLIT